MFQIWMFNVHLSVGCRKNPYSLIVGCYWIVWASPLNVRHPIFSQPKLDWNLEKLIKRSISVLTNSLLQLIKTEKKNSNYKFKSQIRATVTVLEYSIFRKDKQKYTTHLMSYPFIGIFYINPSYQHSTLVISSLEKYILSVYHILHLHSHSHFNSVCVCNRYEQCIKHQTKCFSKSI